MDESILTSIKKLLGINESDTNFDTDIIIHINSSFMVLNQIGIGTEPFYIVDDSETWGNFLNGAFTLEAVKTYIYLKVKLIFDPPLSSSVIESINRQIGELEWRIQVAGDSIASNQT